MRKKFIKFFVLKSFVFPERSEGYFTSFINSLYICLDVSHEKKENYEAVHAHPKVGIERNSVQRNRK